MNWNTIWDMLMTNYYWVELVLAIGLVVFFTPMFIRRFRELKSTK